ncbi:hypothetical protein [Streptomyces sp. 900116325]
MSHDDKAMQALSDAGAQCGVCGDQPGDRTCPDCERCYRRYVEGLRAAGWAPRAEVLNEVADTVTVLRDTTDVNAADGNRYDFRQRVALRDAEDSIRRIARKTATEVTS